jgi:hypothetical protein
MMKRFLVACVAATAIGAAAGFATPADAAGVKVGVLTCHVSSGWGFVFGSSRDLNCSYSPKKKGGHAEHYVGTVSKYGVDIGYTESAVIVWAVVAPTSDLKPGALEGNYAGVTASATLGYGLGANALLGGFDKSIALQPLSIEGNKGLNVAAGIGAMSLKSTP